MAAGRRWRRPRRCLDRPVSSTADLQGHAIRLETPRSSPAAAAGAATAAAAATAAGAASVAGAAPTAASSARTAAVAVVAAAATAAAAARRRPGRHRLQHRPPRMAANRPPSTRRWAPHLGPPRSGANGTPGAGGTGGAGGAGGLGRQLEHHDLLDLHHLLRCSRRLRRIAGPARLDGRHPALRPPAARREASMDRTSTSAASPRTLSSRLREDQSGAIIILALAFITIVLALAVGHAWACRGPARRSLRAYRLERHRRYAADAAMQSAVQYVRQNPLIGVSGASPPACGMNYTVQEDTASGGAIQVFTPGSVLNVTCGPPPASGLRGPRDGRRPRTARQRRPGPTRRDLHGQSAPTTPSPAKGTLTCGSGSNTLVLGRARVRYDIDFGIVRARPPRHCGPFDDSTHGPPVDPNGPGQQPVHRLVGARRGAQDRLLVHQGRLIGSNEHPLSRTAHRLVAPHRLA